MTPEAQRIAIAEACGWTLDHKGAIRADGYRSELWGKPPHEALPDYLNDLNAMHEAEKVLIDHQCKKYRDVLVAEVIGWSAHENELIAIHATAAQRAEAFLRTIKKWKTNQNKP